MVPSCVTLKDFRKPAALPTPPGLVGAPCELTAVGAANAVNVPTVASFSTRLALACVAFDAVVVPGMNQGAPAKAIVSVPALVNWPLALNVIADVAPPLTVIAPPLRSGELAPTVQLPEPAGFGVNVITIVCCAPRLSNTWICCVTGPVACEFRFPNTSKAVVLLAAFTVCGM